MKSRKRSEPLLKKQKPKLIAIVGGSGSGKTWLAAKLEKVFGEKTTRLSLDDFYRDRSHLTENRRRKINFDHPRAIDWKNVERVLGKISDGRSARAPKYDFATHTRAGSGEFVEPKSLVIVDGLWLLRRASIRKLFSYRIFIDCSQRLRFLRRLNRDLQERERSQASVRKQFLRQVAPMHNRFVSPQRHCANIVITNPGESEITELTKRIREILKSN